MQATAVDSNGGSRTQINTLSSAAARRFKSINLQLPFQKEEDGAQQQRPHKKGQHNATFEATTGMMMDAKLELLHYVDEEEYLGSNIEHMSRTPSSTPPLSPSCSNERHSTPISPPAPPPPPPLPISATATESLSKIATINTNNYSNSNSSNSSSKSNSSSASTISSVINTPTSMSNGISFKLAADSNSATLAANYLAMDDSHHRSCAEQQTSTPANGANSQFSASGQLSNSNTSTSITASLSTSSASSSSSASSASIALPLSRSASSATTTTSTPASITPTKSSEVSAKSITANLLQWQDMPKYLQFNPYVLKGYRPLQTFRGCLLSFFHWHNETINILTHAIPILYILAIVPGLMPWKHGYRFLSFCHVFGSVAPWCGSFIYHLFMNIEKGEAVYYTLLKLDMVGIWVTQSFGALPLVTATTFCFTFKWKWFTISTYCLMSLWGLYKALTAVSPWQRRLCFALPFSMRSFLTILRTVGQVGGNRVALPHVYLQDVVSLLGGAIGAMRIPEKWFPGLVDFYLNSHNIMHVLVVVAVYSMHKATIKDFEWMSTTTCDAYTANNSNSTFADDIAETLKRHSDL